MDYFYRDDRPVFKLYRVIRPYCTPNQVLVSAKTSSEAKKLCDTTYGLCSNKKAIEIKIDKTKVIFPNVL